MILRLRRRPGYIFLISVLVIGAVASATSVSLILLGLASEQSGLTVVQSAQAIELAQACAERALLFLRSDLSYGGGETLVIPGGTCVIHHVGGSGNADRTLCLEGVSGLSTRRIEISVSAVYPSMLIGSWQEVDSFALCS
jgi:hypothetical protein